MKAIIIFLLGFLLGLAFGATSYAGSLRQGFGLTCGERQSVIDELERTYSEVPDHMGLALTGSMVEVLVSPSGTFTIILTRPNGLSCLMTAGEHWGPVTPKPKGPRI